MFLLYYSVGCNIHGTVFRECYPNDLHTTSCSGVLGHYRTHAKAQAVDVRREIQHETSRGGPRQPDLSGGARRLDRD